MRITVFMPALLLLSLAACGLDVTTHTPDVVEQDRPHKLDAGTVPTELICPPAERAKGRCG